MNLKFHKKDTRPETGTRGGVYFIKNEGKIYLYDTEWEDYTYLAGKLQNSITIGSKVFDGTKSISIDKSDIGLGNVDNTADKDKKVLQATNDGNGNNISDTYIKLRSINSHCAFVNSNYNNLLYTSIIQDGFAACSKWATVTSSDTFSNWPEFLFNGNYEIGQTLSVGTSGTITIDFSVISGYNKYPDYPYGDFLFYFYSGNYPKDFSVKVYNNWSGQEIGWHDLTVDKTDNHLYKCTNTWYGLQKIEINITARDDAQAKLVEIEFNRTRSSILSQPQAILTKYKAETLYYPLTAPSFIGNLTGNASSSTISDSTKWIEYE